MPMEGMDQWPSTEHPKPQPPAYVKMPGRPRKERRREPGEARKATKLSRGGKKAIVVGVTNQVTMLGLVQLLLLDQPK